MTINNVHVLASGRLFTQLVLAERSQTESSIAVRAIRQLFPDLELRPVMNLAEAKSVLAGTARNRSCRLGPRPQDVFTDDPLVARKRCGIVIALLKNCDDRHRQEALEAGASYVRSKPELLVAQLRYEVGARLGCEAPERPRVMG